MKKRFLRSFLWALIAGMTMLAVSCSYEKKDENGTQEKKKLADSLSQVPKEPEWQDLRAEDIQIDKSYTFEKYLLEDQYEYQDQPRSIKWDIIKRYLAKIENFSHGKHRWMILVNYKNKNGSAARVTDDEGNIVWGKDAYGVKHYQAVPLYSVSDPERVLRYGRDGWLGKELAEDSLRYKISIPDVEGAYWVPKSYVHYLGDSVRFTHAIFIDREDQNIVTLEQTEIGHWHALSSNPATTGVNRPPHKLPTPTGIYVLQQKKERMYYYKDGTTEIGGFAPYASRFSKGAYIHGVPTPAPGKKIREYSWSLGTIPRSHMCVRNASSHAKFIFDWAPVNNSLIIVIESEEEQESLKEPQKEESSNAPNSNQ